MRRALWLAGMLTGAYTLEIVHKFDPQRDYSGCWKPCAFTFCRPLCPETTTGSTPTSTPEKATRKQTATTKREVDTIIDQSH